MLAACAVCSPSAPRINAKQFEMLHAGKRLSASLTAELALHCYASISTYICRALSWVQVWCCEPPSHLLGCHRQCQGPCRTAMTLFLSVASAEYLLWPAQTICFFAYICLFLGPCSQLVEVNNSSDRPTASRGGVQRTQLDSPNG